MKNAGLVYYLLILVLLTNAQFDYAQSKQKTFASGEALVRIEYNMTLDQARDLARELSIINAIEKAYGTYVEQEANIRIQEGQDAVYIIGTTRVKGEWLETKKESQNVFTEGKDIYMKCKIEGYVVPARPKASIEFLSLNCPVKQCRTTNFYNEESLFLYFRSPVRGYLSVFLDDGEHVMRLLPYIGMKGSMESCVPVAADREYVFFSSEQGHQYFEGYHADNIVLTTKRSSEFHSLYLVFAREEFMKPMLLEETLRGDGYIIPQSLKSETFKKWLAISRSEIESFQDVRISLVILKSP